MVKRINAPIPDEMHKSLRVKLAEDGANFSEGLRAMITEYVGGKKRKVKWLSPGVPAKYNGIEGDWLRPRLLDQGKTNPGTGESRRNSFLSVDEAGMLLAKNWNGWSQHTEGSGP